MVLAAVIHHLRSSKSQMMIPSISFLQQKVDLEVFLSARFDTCILPVEQHRLEVYD